MIEFISITLLFFRSEKCVVDKLFFWLFLWWYWFFSQQFLKPLIHQKFYEILSKILDWFFWTGFSRKSSFRPCIMFCIFSLLVNCFQPSGKCFICHGSGPLKEILHSLRTIRISWSPLSCNILAIYEKRFCQCFLRNAYLLLNFWWRGCSNLWTDHSIAFALPFSKWGPDWKGCILCWLDWYDQNKFLDCDLDFVSSWRWFSDFFLRGYFPQFSFSVWLVFILSFSRAPRISWLLQCIILWAAWLTRTIFSSNTSV